MTETQKAGLSACSTCGVKSASNCQGHLTPVVDAVVAAFVEARIAFEPANLQHGDIVAAILAEDIRDAETGKPVAYEVPEEPRVKNWFYGLVAQRTAAELSRK